MKAKEKSGETLHSWTVFFHFKFSFCAAFINLFDEVKLLRVCSFNQYKVNLWGKKKKQQNNEQLFDLFTCLSTEVYNVTTGLCLDPVSCITLLNWVLHGHSTQTIWVWQVIPLVKIWNLCKIHKNEQNACLQILNLGQKVGLFVNLTTLKCPFQI